MIQASRLGFSPTQNGYFTCEDEDLHLENKELTNEQWIEYDYDYVSKQGDWPIGLHFMAIKNMEKLENDVWIMEASLSSTSGFPTR